MNGLVREVKDPVGNVGAKLKLNGERQTIVASLFAVNTVLLAETAMEW